MERARRLPPVLTAGPSPCPALRSAEADWLGPFCKAFGLGCGMLVWAHKIGYTVQNRDAQARPR